MKKRASKFSKPATVLLALDLTHQSGREHLAGFYKYADEIRTWRVRLVPSTEPSYLPMIRMILNKGVDGVIIKGECVKELSSAIKSAGVPIVSIDKPQLSSDNVANVNICNDNRLIGLEAARYFDSLGNFASYGFVPDPKNCEWSNVRGAAFCAEAKAKHPDAIVTIANNSLQEWLKNIPKPAAIFSAFDKSATEIIEMCQDLRIHIPNDALILGVDDDELLCNHTRPKLSSIKPDHERQGFEAAKALDRLMSGWQPKKNSTMVFPPINITERDTTATVPPAIHLVRQICAYLDEYALEMIRVSDVIKHVKVSSRLANLRFKQIKKCSIQEEIIKRRLTEVKRLLKSTEWTMSRITKKCGFKSQIVLAHLFKARFGMSMTDWRNSAQSQGTESTKTAIFSSNGRL